MDNYLKKFGSCLNHTEQLIEVAERATISNACRY